MESEESRSGSVSPRMLLPHLTLFRLLAHHWINGDLHLDLNARQRSAVCPSWQHCSTAVHRAYRRTVADLPLSGAKTLWPLQVRRFFCRYSACLRRLYSAVARSAPGDCRHGAACPGQSPDGLPVSRDAPAAGAAAITTPWAASGRALHSVSAAVVECWLSSCPTALAGVSHPGSPAVAEDGGVVHRPMAAGNGPPVQIPPSGACPLICGGR